MFYLSKNERRQKTYYRDVRRLICETLSISDRKWEQSQPAWNKFLKTLDEAEKSGNSTYPLEGDLPSLSKLAKDITAKPLYRAMAMAICLSPEKNPTLFFWNETNRTETKRNLHRRGELSYFQLEWQNEKNEDPRLIRFSHLLLERNIREAKLLDSKDWCFSGLMKDYNSSILYALRILPEDDILAQKLFGHYSLDLEPDNRPGQEVGNNYTIDGYNSFSKFLLYQPMPPKWKYEMDKKMRSIIVTEQISGETEPCRSLLAYSKRSADIFSYFEKQQKRLDETGMFSSSYALYDLPLLPLFASQLEFLLGFSSVEQKLYCVFPKKVPKLFRVFHGDEYKKLRYCIARHVVLLEREHPWALWRELANGYADGTELAKLLLAECADDVELVARIKRDMAEAEKIHKRYVAETDNLKSKLQQAFDCLK